MRYLYFRTADVKNVQKGFDGNFKAERKKTTRTALHFGTLSITTFPSKAYTISILTVSKKLELQNPHFLCE